jgi:hypothetical protein
MFLRSIYCSALLLTAAALLLLPAAPTSGLSIIAVTDTYGGVQVRFWQNSSGVIYASTSASLRGFLGNTTVPSSFVPFPNEQGFFFHYNLSSFEPSVVPVANDVQSILSSPMKFVLNESFANPTSPSQDGYMPNDENERYYYYAGPGSLASFFKIDLTTGAVINDSFWPMEDACASRDLNLGLYAAGISANSTHFFISCYGNYGGVFAYPRANPSNETRAIISLVPNVQYGPTAADNTYLYIPQWPGLTIHRYNYRTGVLDGNWTSLNNYGESLSGYGVWRLRMYSENGKFVLWAQIYGDFLTQSNCLRRVDLQTGAELSVVISANVSCPPGLSDFVIIPEAGAPRYASQPVPLPAPVAPPMAPPVASPIATPMSAPIAAPTAGSSSPVATKAPTKPGSSSASGLFFSASALVVLVLSMLFV